ncbi:PCNA-associated factor [Nerophis lumbriciformis]|uniref:PCNA-associated factor n=1 Tax=Nerophis lumbriciformis TaxID=546530 RepID=UPI002ADF2582|nr:PCNA-associated factor-like [Nerophis lumbriciformis]XP_061896633.1 PCNA-associated factor [Entelurus aequoreus]
MVRTKADSVPGAYRKAVAASAPRKSLGSRSANASSSSSYSSDSATPVKNKYAGGNPVCQRPTPTWQKGIGDFFGGPGMKPEKENQSPPQPNEEDNEEAAGSSMSKTSRKSRPLPSEDEGEED